MSSKKGDSIFEMNKYAPCCSISIAENKRDIFVHINALSCASVLIAMERSSGPSAGLGNVSLPKLLAKLVPDTYLVRTTLKMSLLYSCSTR